MKIARNLSEISKDENTVLTVGTFDGAHLGHAEIFNQVKKGAAAVNGRSVIVTFQPHPRTVVSKDFIIKLITTFEEKVNLISKFDIDYLVVLEFNTEFSRLSSKEFIKNILIDKLGLRHFIIGHDHKFGRDRLGDELKLRELGKNYNFDVTAVEPVFVDNKIINSTNIRNFLSKGMLKDANLLLGRYYNLSGKVVVGATRGRFLGFPTANILIENKSKLIPKTGVYAVVCELKERKIFGVMNIGFRPTFEKHGQLIVEVHLFNFNEDIYGENLNIYLVSRLRDEKKFDTKEELIYQIERDKKEAIQILSTLIN